MVHRPRGLHPRHSVLNQWDLLDGDSTAGRTARPDPARDAVDMAADADAGRSASRRRLADGRRASMATTLIVVHVSAGNPVPPLAGAGIRPAGRRRSPRSPPIDGWCSAPVRPIVRPRDRIAAAARQELGAAAARDRGLW